MRRTWTLAALLGATGCQAQTGSASDAAGSISTATAEAETGSSTATLRVLTYNVAVARESSLETLGAVINAAQPDLVGLQELDRFTNRSGPEVDQVAVLAELTGMQSVFIKTTDWDGGEFGMAVLLRSEFAVVSQNSAQLPLPEGGETRWVLTLGVDTDADPTTTELHFSVTHLSPYSPTNRVAQAEVLAQLADEGPALLVGDLNDGPASTPLTILGARFTSAGDLGGSQIDYVLHDNDASWVVLNSRELDSSDHPQAATASDHSAVLAVFAMD